jgi:hypothetical protein
MQKTTFIDGIDFKLEDSQDIFNLSEENWSKFITDFSLDENARLTVLNMFYSVKGNDPTLELITKLSIMYEITGTKLLHSFLYSICTKGTIDPVLQSIAARALYNYDNKDRFAYDAIDSVYSRMGQNVGTPYKIDLVKILIHNIEYQEKACSYFCALVNDEKIECDFRYKTILGLENEKSPIVQKMIQKTLYSFFSEKKNKTEYRILAAQYLLQKYSLQEEEKTEIENQLLFAAQDENVLYKLRADAVDVLLQVGSEKSKKQAKIIINQLSILDNRREHTFYSNAQNVHTVEIEKSIAIALEFLHTFNILKIDDKEITFYDVENKILQMRSNPKIKAALNRIYIDRALYSKYSCLLQHVLLRLWTYIIGHEHEEEMKKRLLEELEEMAETCSSGFISRLINTISGFGDFSIRISWRDQIVSNLIGRLNARIREMDNISLQEKVLDQITLPTYQHTQRRHFLKFLRQNILSVREEMKEEFKKYLDDTTFDLYFRNALSIYETGEFV